MQVRCDYVIESSYYGFVPQFGVQSGSDQVHDIFSLGQTPEPDLRCSPVWFESGPQSGPDRGIPNHAVPASAR